MPAQDVEIAIIGAGPGGTAAAIELARAGREVLLIERKHFPRNKVCGGCLSGRGVGRLKRLLPDEETLPGIAGRRVTFVMGRYRLSHTPRPGQTRMAPRSQLDAALADAAADAGAEVWFGRAAQPRPTDDGWLVEVGGEMIRPRHLLMASGLGHVPGKLPIAGRDARRRLISQQWVMPLGGRLPEFGGVELHWLRGGYVGLASPDEQGCVVALAARAPRKGEATALEQLQRLNPDDPLWDSIPPDAPQRYGGQGCGGFPWRPTRLGDANLLLVGDAAGYEEPYSGEGIGQALHSGITAAESIAAADGDPAAALQAYTDRMRRHHRRIARRTRVVSRILNTRALQTFSRLPPMLPNRWATRIVQWMHVQGG